MPDSALGAWSSGSLLLARFPKRPEVPWLAGSVVGVRPGHLTSVSLSPPRPHFFPLFHSLCKSIKTMSLLSNN